MSHRRLARPTPQHVDSYCGPKGLILADHLALHELFTPSYWSHDPSHGLKQALKLPKLEYCCWDAW